MTRPTKPNAGDIITTTIYGHLTECRVIKAYPFGTVDVERISDGETFRVTGLGWL